LRKEISRLDKTLKGVDANVGQFQRHVGDYKQGLTGLSSLIGGNLLAGGIEQLGQAVFDFGEKSLEAFDKQAKAETALFVALNGDVDALERLTASAREFQKVSLFGDEQIIEQQAFLASLGFTEDQINNIITAAADLSTGTGQTLEFGVRNLAKTFSGLTGELGELIPGLKSFTTEELKAGAAVGFVAQQYEGQAQAAAKVGTGPLTQLKNLIGDLTERFGGLISEGLQKVTPLLFRLLEGAEQGFNFVLGALRPVINSFKSLFAELGEGSGVGEVFNSIFNAVGGVIKFAVLQVKFAIDGFTQFIRVIRRVADEVPIVGKAFDFVKTAITTILDAIGSLPAFIVGAQAAIKQLFDNIKNFD